MGGVSDFLEILKKFFECELRRAQWKIGVKFGNSDIP